MDYVGICWSHGSDHSPNLQSTKSEVCNCKYRPSTVSYFSYFFLLLSHFSYFLENVLLLTKDSYFFLLLKHFSYFFLNILQNRLKPAIGPKFGATRHLSVGLKFRRYAALLSSSMLPWCYAYLIVYSWILVARITYYVLNNYPFVHRHLIAISGWLKTIAKIFAGAAAALDIMAVYFLRDHFQSP